MFDLTDAWTCCSLYLLGIPSRTNFISDITFREVKTAYKSHLVIFLNHISCFIVFTYIFKSLNICSAAVQNSACEFRFPVVHIVSIFFCLSSHNENKNGHKKKCKPRTLAPCLLALKENKSQPGTKKLQQREIPESSSLLLRTKAPTVKRLSGGFFQS